MRRTSPGHRRRAFDRDHARRQGLRDPPRRRRRLQVRVPRPPGAARGARATGVVGADDARAHRGDARRRRLPGARHARRRVRSTAARCTAPSAPASTPYFGDRRRPRHRDRVGVRHRVRATTCSTRWGGVWSERHRARRVTNPRGDAVRRPLARRSRSTAGSRSLRRATTAPPSPAGVTSERRGQLEDDDGAQHLAALHLVERVLDLVEARWSRSRSGRGRAGLAGTGR